MDSKSETKHTQVKLECQQIHWQRLHAVPSHIFRYTLQRKSALNYCAQPVFMVGGEMSQSSQQSGGTRDFSVIGFPQSPSHFVSGPRQNEHATKTANKLTNTLSRPFLRFSCSQALLRSTSKSKTLSTWSADTAVMASKVGKSQIVHSNDS